MNDPFSPERKTVWLKKQNLFGSGYAGFGWLLAKRTESDRLEIHGMA